ncbi:MAG: recombinase family protein [Gemmatales bacterium]
MTMDYDNGGRERTELAEKIIFAQISLAKRGFSTGGRPPYGFQRWLVNEEGKRVREHPLLDGERVRMAGHHTIWLPTDAKRLEIALRIRQMLKVMPATQVCDILTSEGIETPDKGRTRTDNGVKHQVSTTWHQSTVIDIGRSELYTALKTYNRRSMGDQLRATPDGPRPLEDADWINEKTKKVVINPEDALVKAHSHFRPVVNLDSHEELKRILDKRAGSQRGKPRSKGRAFNPLGARIFDMNCGWPLYRQAYAGSFRYVCGYYQQSNGKQCDHNRVDGLLAVRFAKACIRQMLFTPSLVAKFQSRLEEIAKQHTQAENDLHHVSELTIQLA